MINFRLMLKSEQGKLIQNMETTQGEEEHNSHFQKIVGRTRKPLNSERGSSEVPVKWRPEEGI